MVPAIKEGLDRWIATFVADLAAVASGQRFTNFYAAADDPSGVRRHNLATYLQQTIRREPRVMLVGEAPGYRGTRVTGVPFADVRLLAAGVPALSMLGLSRGYRLPGENGLPAAEQTSGMVWGALAAHDFVPLLWAAFPFHPHGATPNSNRAPLLGELDLGASFLRRLIRGAGIDRVVAVGRVAERALHELDVDAERIRHPSRGGKREFNLGLERIVIESHCLHRVR